MARWIGAWLALGAGLINTAGGGQPEPVGKLPRQPFFQYRTTDRFDRTITFYLSEEPDDAQLPLFVFVHGSGAQPLFARQDGRFVGQCGQNTIADVVRGRARLLLVEKPGVTPFAPFEHPGSAIGADEAFLREHTLERWAAAIAASIRSARRLPEIEDTRLLVGGHSEGGLVACRVAAELEEVTHVVSLAGGGVTQLFDLLVLAEEGHLYAHAGPQGQDRVTALLRDWNAVLATPAATDQLFLGHPHRRWSSFLTSSPLEELNRSTARVFVAQGAGDTAVSRRSFEVLQAHLRAHGRDAIFELMPAADHSFAVTSDTGERSSQWGPLFERILAWYLAPPD